MNTFQLWRLFHRPGTRGSTSHTSVLAITAFASATAVFLTVLGGLHGFIWRASADHTFGCMINSNSARPVHTKHGPKPWRTPTSSSPRSATAIGRPTRPQPS